MKRRFDSEDDSGDESDGGEEPMIQLILQDLPGSVSYEHASSLLHSMAASKNILFWNLRGELMRHQRRIPKTNMTELLEYVLLPFNEDLPRPHGLNSFIEGLAELKINKAWIGNNLIASEILDEEEPEEMSESESEENPESESEEASESESEEIPESESEENPESEESEEKTVKKSHCSYCQNPNIDVKKTVECPICKWEDMITYPVKLKKLVRCSICRHRFILNFKTAGRQFKKCDQCKTLIAYPKEGQEEEVYDLE